MDCGRTKVITVNRGEALRKKVDENLGVNSAKRVVVLQRGRSKRYQIRFTVHQCARGDQI